LRRVCQYLGCGTGAVSALFRKEGVTVSGPRHRRFCSQCGTQIFSEAEERPAATFIREGTLDNPDLAAPTAIIWLGMLRSESAQDRGTAALAESLTAAAGALRFSGARGVGGDELLIIRNLCYRLDLLELDSARSRRPDEKMECASI
jgi:Glutathione-dependent formaldehyde-activating enzyme